MNKIYLGIVIAGLKTSLFAQYAVETFSNYRFTKETTPKAEVLELPEKVSGVAFWNDDFSNPSNWVINSNGQVPTSHGWNINSTKETWSNLPEFASLSGGNNAELINGDPTLQIPTQATNVVYTLTTAQPILLDAEHRKISLAFLQFGARYKDLQEMQISRDGVTFITVGNNMDFQVLSTTGGSFYPNPSQKVINLTSYLADVSQIWIRFKWTSRFPTETNKDAWVTYGWFIDDVRLITNSEYDLSVTNSFWGTEGVNYSKIPLTQVAPIQFSANLLNNGTKPMTNAALHISVNSGIFLASSEPVTLQPLAKDSVHTTPFKPTTVGAYVVNRTVTADDQDDVPENNAFPPISFNVTNYVYARDYANSASKEYLNVEGEKGFEAGNVFDIWKNQQLKGITFIIAPGSVIGEEVYVKLYEMTEDGPVYLTESDPFFITSSIVNTEKTVLLRTPADLLANRTYLAVIGSAGGGLRIIKSGKANIYTSFLLDKNRGSQANPEGKWFMLLETPAVRLNFDPTLGVEENTILDEACVLFPNPTTGETRVKFSVNQAMPIAVAVSDITGKQVQTANLMSSEGVNQFDIDLTPLVKGVYYVTLTAGELSLTKKVIKE